MKPRLPIIITDLDRTFSDARLRAVPAAVQAMQSARTRGHPTILATGRTLPELRRKSGLLDVFDYVIAEGGGLLGTPAEMRPLNTQIRPVERLHLWLNEKAILHERGVASISVSRNDLATLRAYPALRSFQVTPNRNRADATLRGVDKGRAIARLRRIPALRGRAAIGFGDGENDIPLFQAVDVRVAVLNAVPGLQKRAHAITRYPGGRGVADYLRRNVLALRPAIKTQRGIRPMWTPSSNSRTSPRSSTRAAAKRSPPSTASR